ncbi:MAG: hypothetical protein VXZ82_16190 [Planctomycetota bacterium]|nr:hypothetical protein [Planctomycetota bacterium]
MAQPNAGDSEEKPTTDRELYQSASDALALGRYDAAALPLQELHEKHPDFVLRNTVCVYLSECLIRQGKAEQGFQLLQELQNQLSRARQAEKASGEQLKAQELDEKLLKRVATLQRYAARVAAADAEKEQRFSDAIKWLQWTGAASPEEQAALRKESVRIGMKVAWQQLKTDGDPQKALSELTKLSPILREQEGEILFSVAEKLTESKRTALAQPIYEQLSQRLPTGGAMPCWAHVVDLRLMQYSLQKKHYSNCTRLFELARRRYEPVQLAEIEFLQAQAAIAQIDFEAAIKLLGDVEAEAKKNRHTEYLAKAVWLQGEVWFLKRDYANAIQSYDRVLRLQTEEWTQRAALQRAKCLELSGQWQLALAAYQELKFTNQESTANKLIEQRIAVLQESIQTQNR